MSALDLPPESFDLGWSEGALYNLGLETALPMCAVLLRSGGYLAFAEAVWRTTYSPPEVREAFADCPTMGRVKDVVPLIEAYSLVDLSVCPMKPGGLTSTFPWNTGSKRSGICKWDNGTGNLVVTV
jgi:hypothetical protein